MKYGKIYNTAIGKVLIVATEKGICDVIFGEKYKPEDIIEEQTFLVRKCYKELDEYFQGKRQVFEVPLDLHGTDFQKRVWNELRNIPYGETRSYKDIAISLGIEKGSQAVGQANKFNPVPILIPCHRVINHNGTIGGYGYGLEMKSFLLLLERQYNCV